MTSRLACMIVAAMLCGSAPAMTLVEEATVAGDSREAGFEAVQLALRGVIDSAVVKTIGPRLAQRFRRELEAHIHARRRAFISHYRIPFLVDKPYDGITTRKVSAEVSLETLADTLIAMGLAWRDPEGKVAGCREVVVNFADFSPHDALALANEIEGSGLVARNLGTVEKMAGPQMRFLISGSPWDLARSLAQLSAERFSVGAVAGDVIDLIAGGDLAIRPSDERENLPPLEIMELWIDELFPARHPRYAHEAVGRLVVANHGAHAVSHMDVEVECPAFLEVPWVMHAGPIAPGTIDSLLLLIPFSGARLMAVRDETQTVVRVTLTWSRGGEEKQRAATTTVTVHSRNAVDWNDVRSACAFVTPSAPVVEGVARRAMSTALQGQQDLPGSLARAFKIVQALSSFELAYTPDPPSPVSAAYDHMQFSNETLRLGAGDCEDTAVLLGSCLENGDLPVQLLLTQDHVFAAFNTGLYSKDGFLISPDRERFLVLDGRIWLPIETTLLSQGFLRAWNEGVQTYRALEKTGDYLERVDVRRGWRIYPPAGTPGDDGFTKMPDMAGASAELRALLSARRKAVAEVEERLHAAVKAHPEDWESLYRLGVLLGRESRAFEALESFKRIPDGVALGAQARIGEGNSYLVESKVESALVKYRHAVELDPDSPVAHVNLGVAYYLGGDEEGAVESFASAVDLLPGEEKSLAHLLGVDIEELGTKAADARQRQALSKGELRALMDKVRKKKEWKRLADRGPSRHKFAGRKALDPEQRLCAERLVFWPEIEG